MLLNLNHLQLSTQTAQSMIFVALLLAHVQAVLIPVWIASRIYIRQAKLRIIFPDGGISLLRFGFICFSVAALAEIMDHTETSWIYINRLSGWNGFFYAALSGGLASLTAAVTEKKQLRIFIYLIVFAVIATYSFLGKGAAIALQFSLTIIFLAQWWKYFHDPLLWIYPSCGIIPTTLFGVLLSATGDQIWHVLIGPAGSTSLIVLRFILIRAERRIASRPDA